MTDFGIQVPPILKFILEGTGINNKFLVDLMSPELFDIKQPIQ